MTLTWHACKYKIHELHQRYILKRSVTRERLLPLLRWFMYCCLGQVKRQKATVQGKEYFCYCGLSARGLCFSHLPNPRCVLSLWLVNNHDSHSLGGRRGGGGRGTLRKREWSERERERERDRERERERERERRERERELENLFTRTVV